jgi:nucleoside-diphosphate-sugar epimerase
MSPSPSNPRRGSWLLFGATGAVGGFLLQRLQRAGIGVCALSRQTPALAESSGVQWIAGSLEHAPVLALHLQAGFAPQVVACAGPLDAFADWLARHPPASGTRVLALSSLSADYKRESLQPDERALADRLIAAEALLQQTCIGVGARATVLRAGLIYGTGVDRSLSPLLRAARRWRVLPWPGAANGRREPVHADDLAAALLAAADLRDPAPELLRLPGPEQIGWIEMLRRTFSLEPTPPRLLVLPTPGLRRLAAYFATGVGRLGRIASTVHRLHLDQCAASSDWAQLGLRPRDFATRVESGPVESQT